ncbi:hypothetical protein [Methylobacterium aerolatum]|uniref:Uncharacterized protein n=1 Tax=Methylobacterium aerolatum TaxID=418708 RepID=A0ABU0I3Z0_9HYPH|nr:hypothetical protein [Methylobacterium aerolatum]MDQ0449326.1 hypothetical protein [Methylobacterium aerolatum]GJD36725.1 hypothetical protein FMGBMHLM_3648 [Methylobacterium aerolatum]
MRILRLLLGVAVVTISTVIVIFVVADRIAHLTPPATVARTAARAVTAEPSATGSIPAPVAAPAPALKKAAPAIPNGFDTERLRDLMRADPLMRGR